MTVRSVIGVKAPGGRPGMELSAGVVAGLLVVKSVLLKHLTSTTVRPRAATNSLQRSCAILGKAIAAHKTATIDNTLFVLICFPLGVARIAHLPLCAKSD